MTLSLTHAIGIALGEMAHAAGVTLDPDRDDGVIWGYDPEQLAEAWQVLSEYATGPARQD